MSAWKDGMIADAIGGQRKNDDESLPHHADNDNRDDDDSHWDSSDIEALKQIAYDGQSVLYAPRRIKGIATSGTEFGKKQQNNL
jgi:hypothetical protein